MCANKFKRPVCSLGQGGKCDDCDHVDHIPMKDALLKQHFSGRKILGIYPLMPDNTTHFLAFDFDRHKPTEPDPLQDAVALVETCEAQDLPAFMERSKSGDGYHVWLFFDEAIPAERARLIGQALLEEADVYEVEIMTTTYDRMFPNQDTLAGKGLGNLIAFPWQGQAGKEGHTLFLDPKTGYRYPYENQAAVIEKALETRISRSQIEDLISTWNLEKESPTTADSELKDLSDAIRARNSSEISAGIELIQDAVLSHGWDPGRIKTDSQYNRFDTSKPGGKDGWIICSQKGDMVVATFGCWREGGKYTVSNRNGNRTAEENKFFQNHLADAEKQNEAVF